MKLTAGSPSGRSVKVWKYSRIKIMKSLWSSSTTKQAALWSEKAGL